MIVQGATATATETQESRRDRPGHVTCCLTPAMNGRKIALLARNHDTAQTMSDYLMRAGARVRTLDAEVKGSDEEVDAAIFFPDEFTRAEAELVLERLTAVIPRRALIVVTAEPTAFDRVDVVVLRKPAWGWLLMDVMRAAWSDERKDSGRRESER